MEDLLMVLNAETLKKMDDVLMLALSEMQKAETSARTRTNDEGYMLCIDLFMEVERVYKIRNIKK